MSAFRLQRVLELRKRREEEALTRLAAASRARAATEAALAALIAEERLQRDALAQRLAGGRIDPDKVREFGRVLDVYAKAIAGKRVELQRRFEEEEQARAALTAATVARKALDRARERHEEREHAERQRHENSFLDEIATLRAARLDAASALTGGWT
jgi:flagellar export protein FliJ